MGSSVIFSGTKVKTLKSTIDLNGGNDIISSTTDPTSVAVSANIGSLLLNSSSGKLYRKNDSGSSTNWTEVGASGQAGINYISNPNASTNTTGWNTYADAAGSAPVDGTGGVANVTWTRSTTTPLRGAADFEFAKDAVNRQGQGVSTDFTIDNADIAKVLTVTFDYEVVSGTYATGDLTVYLIADPSGTPVVIQPAGYQIQSATASTKMRNIATFQTQASGVSYRLCFHVASTSASAYTLAIENVVVGPQVVQYGSPITDWQSYTPTFTGFGTPSGVSAYYRRNGGNLEVYFTVTAGTSTATQAQMTLPSGLTIDGSKIVTNQTVGQAFYDLSTASSVNMIANGGNAYIQMGQANNVSYNSCSPANGSVLLSSGQKGIGQFSVPISGWSSTVVMSNDTDTRVVAATYTGGGVSVSAATYTVLKYTTKSFDSHSAYNTTSGAYVVPVPGLYQIEASINSNGTNQAGAMFIGVGVNTTAGLSFRMANRTLVANVQDGLAGSCIVSANAGDSLYILFYAASGTITLESAGTFSISRLSGPSAIAANESIVMRAYKNTGSHTSNSNWQIVASWNSSPVDTHGGFNTTSGEYTVPIGGKYQVSGSLAFANAATGSRGVRIDVDGAAASGGSFIGANTTGFGTGIPFSAIVSVTAGQKISISGYQNNGGNVAYETTANFIVLSIVRVGN